MQDIYIINRSSNGGIARVEGLKCVLCGMDVGSTPAVSVRSSPGSSTIPKP